MGKLLDFHIVNYLWRDQLSNWWYCKGICLSDVLCSVLDCASGHYFSQHRTLSPPCRGAWDLVLFVYWSIHQELELVQDLQIYSVLKIQSFTSWPGGFKQILSELCQDCSNLMPWGVVHLHAMLTRYCHCLQWWLGFLNNMSSINGLWKGMAPEWCLYVWLALGIGSCDSAESSRHWVGNTKLVSVQSACSISHISVFINVN